MSVVDESLYAQIGRHHPTLSKFLPSTLDPSDVRRIQQQSRPVCLADEGLPFGMPADQLMPTPEFERLIQGFGTLSGVPRTVANEADNVVDRASPADDGRFSPDAPGIAPVPAFVEVLAAEPDDDYHARPSSSTGSGRRHQQQQQQQQQHRHNEQRKTYATLLPGSPRSSPFHGSVSDLSVRRSSPALPHQQYHVGAAAPSMPAPVADLNGQLPYDLQLRGLASAVDVASPWTTLDDTSFQIVPTVDAATRSGPASTTSTSSSYVDDGDRQRQDRKRERNRLAAAKCRQRKLEQIDTLQGRVDELKERNLALERTADDLRREVAALRAVVSNHINSGCRLDLSSAGAMYS